MAISSSSQPATRPGSHPLALISANSEPRFGFARLTILPFPEYPFLPCFLRVFVFIPIPLHSLFHRGRRTAMPARLLFLRPVPSPPSELVAALLPHKAERATEPLPHDSRREDGPLFYNSNTTMHREPFLVAPGRK